MKRRSHQKNGPPPSNGMASLHDRRLLDPFDAAFAQQRPFGDSAYLHEQLHVRYGARLRKLSEAMPVAGELLRALDQAPPLSQHRIIGDPVVRHAAHQALCHVSSGAQDGLALAESEEVFRETLAHLEAGNRGGPLESGEVDGRRLGAEPWHAAVWSEEHRDDVFGRSFRRIVRDHFGGEPVSTASAADIAKLARGAKLLSALLPLCSQSVFSHTHMVVIVPHVGSWKRRASYSEFRMSGIVFLNRDMLGNPWWVAEHLLHESLHQKLYDFRHTHSLMAEDLSPDTPPKDDAAAVFSIWNVGGAARSNAWDTFRAVAAFHVYVHLAVLCVQADLRKTELVNRFGAPDASFPAMTQRRDAFERAQYLARHIKASCWRELGLAGRLFVDWLISILNAIDSAPPPPETLYLHLLLNRYLVEAIMVSNSKLSADLTAQLLKVVDDEMDTVRRVLLAIDADGPNLNRLEGAGARRPGEGAEAAFLRFRNLVARILLTLSPDGYGLRRASSAESTATVEKMIQAMVDRSSQHLIPVLAGSPQ
jgi:hypothetical protein